MLRSFCIASMAIFAVTAALADDHKKIHRASKHVPESYVVLLGDDGNEDPDEVLNEIARRYKVTLTGSLSPLLRGGTFEMSQAAAERVLRDNRVAEVWEDNEVETMGVRSGVAWGLSRIDERMSPRLDETYEYCHLGGSVRAYVVDSGIWKDHDEFSNANPYTPGQARVVRGYDDLNRSSSTLNYSDNPNCDRTVDYDDRILYGGSHGTAVASVLGGKTLGAASEVQLVPVRVFGCTGTAASGAVLRGLNWIIQQPKELLPGNTAWHWGRVVNMSFVSIVEAGSPKTPTETAIDQLISNGFIVVVAAGNFKQDTEGFSPARYAPAIVVGGSRGHRIELASGDDPDANVDLRWDNGPTGNVGSNIGASIDLFAPADRMRVAQWLTPTSIRDENYTRYSSGTSFATPLVAGVVARMLGSSLNDTNGDIESKLIAYATTTAHGLNMYNRGAGSPNRLLYMDGACPRRRPV